jgi:phage terminase large subunit
VIVIDSDRCPNTAREFLNYELEKDSNGNFKAKFPDKNNHSIDAARYALEDDMKFTEKPVADAE